MNTNLTAQAVALLIAGQVEADINAGNIPQSVRTFAELHDYVDANMYALNVLDAAEVEHDPASQEQADMFNEAFELVDAWLNRRGRMPRAGRHS